VYGAIDVHMREGPKLAINACFPPRLGFTGITGGIFHRDLAQFWDDTGNQVLDIPGDAYRFLRMMHAGVLIGTIPDVVMDCFPSRENASDVL
jgi:hypothetical protein